MYEIDIKRDFSAAHHLKNYQGDCSLLHGHNWVVQVFVRSNELDNLGIALDFRMLKNNLDKVLEELDHCNLNDLDFFKTANPTSEHLAKYIYDKLSEEINNDRTFVHKVRVCETPGSGASYFED